MGKGGKSSDASQSKGIPNNTITITNTNTNTLMLFVRFNEK